MGTLQNNTIIPARYLDEMLDDDATNQYSRIDNAVIRATVFVNTYAVNYLEFDAYTVDEGSGDNDDTYTINAPHEIEFICLDVAKTMYYMSIDHVNRDGTEWQRYKDELDYYKDMLKNINIEPKQYSVAISLNTDNAQLIARNQNIIPFSSYITSDTTNIYTNGEDFFIRKGGVYDDEYWDGWYLDANNDPDIEGTLYYYRSWRKDGKDYIHYMKDNPRMN